MSRTTKTFFFAGLSLLIYGYLAREFSLYFFWDSKAFGWLILLLALFLYLLDLNRSRRRQGKSTAWVKIGIAFIFLGLVLSAYLIVDFHRSEPYHSAIEYLKSNQQLKDEIGTIKGFGLIPSGSIETSSFNGSESGRATLFLTVFGDKKYKDVDVNLTKSADADWTVISFY